MKNLKKKKEKKEKKATIHSLAEKTEELKKTDEVKEPLITSDERTELLANLERLKVSGSEAQAKRKVGRPKKEEVIEAPIIPIETELFIRMLFNKLLAKRDKRWVLEEKEISALSSTSDAMLEKYLPKILPYMVEVSFGFSVLTIVVPRLYEILSELIEKKKAKKQNQEKPNAE